MNVNRQTSGSGTSGCHMKSTNATVPTQIPSKSSTTNASFKLEKSRQSARECRARKKLRYEYLEELVADREKAIFALQQELSQLRKICEQVDRGQIGDEMKDEISSWKALLQPQDIRDMAASQSTASPTSQAQQ